MASHCLLFGRISFVDGFYPGSTYTSRCPEKPGMGRSGLTSRVALRNVRRPSDPVLGRILRAETRGSFGATND